VTRVLFAYNGSVGARRAGDEPREIRQHSEEARRMLEKIGIHADAVVSIGNPAEEIIKAAEERRTELVVVGRQGRNAIERFVMGSVSDRVVRHAPCDVLVAR
jgi:nucleotide-binding universal stress UspA family protein